MSFHFKMSIMNHINIYYVSFLNHCILSSQWLLIHVVNPQRPNKKLRITMQTRDIETTLKINPNLNIQRTRCVLCLWCIDLLRIIHWPAGGSMKYYMYHIPSAREQKRLCASDIQQRLQQHSFCTNVLLLYVQTLKPSVSLKTHYLKVKKSCDTEKEPLPI